MKKRVLMSRDFMYLPLGVDTIKNTNKNVPTVYLLSETS